MVDSPQLDHAEQPLLISQMDASRTTSGLAYVAVVSVFDTGDWEPVDVGILGDGSALDDFIVTDPGMATHRRYRNRLTGEIITSRI